MLALMLAMSLLAVPSPLMEPVSDMAQDPMMAQRSHESRWITPLGPEGQTMLQSEWASNYPMPSQATKGEGAERGNCQGQRPAPIDHLQEMVQYMMQDPYGEVF